jgi:hypothetical protein
VCEQYGLLRLEIHVVGRRPDVSKEKIAFIFSAEPAQSKASTVFASSNYGVEGSNPIGGINARAFILCLGCPACR